MKGLLKKANKIKKQNRGAGEVIYCLRVLAALAEGLSSGPNTHTAAHNPVTPVPGI